MASSMSRIRPAFWRHRLSLSKAPLSAGRPHATPIAPSIPNGSASAPPPPPRLDMISVNVFQGYLRPAFFGTVFVGCTFVVCADAYVRQQTTFWQRLAHSRERLRRKLMTVPDDDAFLADMWREKREMIMEKKRQTLDKIKGRLAQYQSMPVEMKRLCLYIAQKYVAMSDAQKTMAGLLAINIGIFGCWQIALLRPFMTTWFMHHPGSGRSITLLTSCFSHQELLHLTLNMVALWSFGTILHEKLGREQFLALYLSTGVSANVVSHMLSLATRRTRPILPSLGASGAIYGCVSGTAILYPQSSVYIAFLPFIPIRLGYALPALMGFDVMGILLRWRMFDHYAHLAGAAAGLSYMYCGQTHLWQPLVKKIKRARDRGRRGRENGSGGSNPETTIEIHARPRLPWRFGEKVSKE